MNLPRILATLACAGWLAGCATQVPRAPLPPAQRAAAQAQLEARETVLAGHRQWSLQGRVALSNGDRGGSGRIHWQQDGDDYQLELSAPITRQSWRIVGDPGSARLEGLDGGPRVGSDATQLLRESTGWEIPVTALSAWVRGARAPQAGPAQLLFDADGRLARLQQAGWTLDFSDWRPDDTLGIELPLRINAERDAARVRLIVDDWSQGAASL